MRRIASIASPKRLLLGAIGTLVAVWCAALSPLAAGAVAAATVVPGHVLGGPRRIAPNEKMNVAGIGVGGMGRANLRHLESQNIIALCDVDFNYAAAAVRRYPDAKRYSDYREMLEKEKQIDGVVVCAVTQSTVHCIPSLSVESRTVGTRTM